MVTVVVAARNGRRLPRVGPGLHPRCRPCPCWVKIHGWCINCVAHWPSLALIPRDARGPSTTLIRHLVVELLPEKRALTVYLSRRMVSIRGCHSQACGTALATARYSHDGSSPLCSDEELGRARLQTCGTR